MGYNPDMPSAPAAALAGDPGLTPVELAASRAKIVAAHPELEDALQKGYEPHDIGLRGVFIFLITLVITMIVVLAAMWGVMKMFVQYDRSKDPIASPVRLENPTAPVPLQPSPRHDYNDREDMTLLREEAARMLSSSGVTPQGRRYVNIDEAMKQVKLQTRPVVQPAAPLQEQPQPSPSQGAAPAGH